MHLSFSKERPYVFAPRYPPPVGADVLGRPQPGPPGGRPLPRTIENLGRPQPPHNAISFDRGCGPPRTSAPTDSIRTRRRIESVALCVCRRHLRELQGRVGTGPLIQHSRLAHCQTRNTVTLAHWLDRPKCCECYSGQVGECCESMEFSGTDPLIHPYLTWIMSPAQENSAAPMSGPFPLTRGRP